MKSKVEVYELVDKDGGILLITGTLEDIRTFIKNRWKECGDFITEMTGFTVEEDFYMHVDNDDNLYVVFDELGYEIDELCSVPIEDFYE